MDGKTERIRPYEGTAPYIFISYSHRDLDRIRPILQGLADRGYRFWYDEGIDPGTEWPESIADHLQRSAVCIAIMSPFSAVSRNCRREINFALSKNIELLTLYIEPTEISPGMEMQLSTHQSIMGYTYPDPASLLDRIGSLDVLSLCQSVWNETGTAGKTRKPAEAAQKKKSYAPLVIALLLVLAAIAAGIWLMRGSRSEEGPSDAVEAAPEATARTTSEATAESAPEPTTGHTAEPTAVPTAESTTGPTPEPTPMPAMSPEPIPEGYTVLASGEWEDCAIAVCEKDEKTVYIQLTDGCFPYAYPFSEHPGNELLDWEVWIPLSQKGMLRFTIRATAYTPSADYLKTMLTLETDQLITTIGSFQYTLKGSTFCFEAALPEEYTTKDFANEDIVSWRIAEDGSQTGYNIIELTFMNG